MDRLIVRMDSRRLDFDRGLAFDQQALRDADLVLRAARGTPVEGPTAVMVAGIHYLRFIDLPQAEGQASLEAAVALTVPYARHDPRIRSLLKGFAQTAPELLPPDLRAQLHTPGMTFGKFKTNSAADILKRAKPTSAGDPGLRYAITLFRHALDDLSATPADRADTLNQLAMAYEKRQELSGAVTDMEPVIRTWREAVATVPTGTQEHAIYLHRLSAALEKRFELRSDPADLDESVTTARAACEAVARSHWLVPMFRNNLSLALCRRGNAADLDEAVTAARTALSAAGPDHKAITLFRTTLTKALHARFRNTGDWRDLREAMRLDGA
ncbi:tetratricopeptide repeat protein [Streptomyces sp. DG2A-72]|uniref:tetratricopeptide repeat protein n=1 Tax=Streptomyces sp. DG2A-72 TaxID=3051386 RepID=UPI00265BCFD1|nr:tetratricopeptide repeat protein [Streptomyces sp. DG2A-72]MDO0933483.1 tetratricopeptide repeat protein [Streptomyces sp. DG2A-72]